MNKAIRLFLKKYMIAMVPPRKPHNPFWPSADDYGKSGSGSELLSSIDRDLKPGRGD